MRFLGEPEGWRALTPGSRGSSLGRMRSEFAGDAVTPSKIVLQVQRMPHDLSKPIREACATAHRRGLDRRSSFDAARACSTAVTCQSTASAPTGPLPGRRDAHWLIPVEVISVCNTPLFQLRAEPRDVLGNGDLSPLVGGQLPR